MSFDDKAKTWDKDQSKIERAHLLAQKISHLSKEKGLKTALEFGCGTGLVSFFLKNEFDEITLADTSSGMIEVLKEKIHAEEISNFKPVLLQSNRQLPSHKFDAIYSLMVMHHVNDLDDAFSHFYRILKPESYLIIADLVKEDGDYHGEANSSHPHNGFDKEELIEHLEKFKFQFIEYQIFYSMQKITAQGTQKNFPLFLLIARKI